MSWWRAAAAAGLVGTVARLWALGQHRLTFDESFTGTAATKPVGAMLEHLREVDAHPPLDYLLRAPLAGTGNEWLLRAPSAIWSIATLVVLAWWMRRYGRRGAITVIIASLAPFAILHGREARMYALVILAGTVVGAAADTWRTTPRRRTLVVLGSAALVAALAHSATLIFICFLGLLPGLRRDRQAWEFRFTIACVLALWAALWGPSFLEQAQGAQSSWIPLTSADHLRNTVTGLVSTLQSATTFGPVMLLIGLAALVHRRTDRALVLTTFVGPLIAVSVIGLWAHVLLPRTFAFSAWAVCFALATVVDEALDRFSLPVGAAAAAVIALLLVPPTIRVVREERESVRALDAVTARLTPGDAVAIAPSWLGPVAEWEFVINGSLRVGDETDDEFRLAADAEPTGRTWVLWHEVLGGPPEWERCADDVHVGAYWVSCRAEDGLVSAS